MQLYEPTRVQEIAAKRDKRRIEQMLAKEDGWPVQPVLVLAKLNEIVVAKYDVKPPEGGRVYLVRAKVSPGLPWESALLGGGPDTPKNYNIWKVGDQYPSQEGPIVDREVFLANFGPRVVPVGAAHDWGTQNLLTRGDARTMFATAKDNPKLDELLGMNPMYLVSLEECSFEGLRSLPSVWWSGTSRRSSLDWTTHGLYGFDWVPFVRE